MAKHAQRIEGRTRSQAVLHHQEPGRVPIKLGGITTGSNQTLCAAREHPCII